VIGKHRSPDFYSSEGRAKMEGPRLTKVRRQKGQGMVEYALILVLVSIVVIVILVTMGAQIANVFSNIVAGLSS
jgi:pilus assembly protein Flp/PilA